MQSKAASVSQYLAQLPAERRAALTAVRAVILENLGRDYEEGMQYGMIGYYVPHRVFPAGYHCDPDEPLPFAGLASQKNHMALYLMSVYFDAEEARRLREQFAQAGKKLDMGKSCIRFRKLEDLPLPAIGTAIRRVPAKKYVALYTALLATSKTARAKRASGSRKKTSTKKTATSRTRN